MDNLPEAGWLKIGRYRVLATNIIATHTYVSDRAAGDEHMRTDVYLTGGGKLTLNSEETKMLNRYLEGVPIRDLAVHP